MGQKGRQWAAGRVSERDTIVLPDQQSRPCLLDEAFVAVAPGSSIRAVCINVCSMHLYCGTCAVSVVGQSEWVMARVRCVHSCAHADSQHPPAVLHAAVRNLHIAWGEGMRWQLAI